MPDRAVQYFVSFSHMRRLPLCPLHLMLTILFRLQHQCVYRGEILRVERKVFRTVGTPRRVRSQAFNNNMSATPITPARGHFSARRDTPGRAENGRAYNPSPLGQAYVPLGYPARSPATPADGTPMYSAAGIPVTPTGSAFAPNPFTFAGGYWTGMVQDPVTRYTYYPCTPAVAPTHAAPVPETPTRGRTREHRYHNNA
jgi:hypothetical protein